MAFITAITDRTQNDVNNKTEKGYFNKSDINRIEYNIEYVRETIISYGYLVEDMTIKTDWVKEDMIYLVDLERIRSNINILKEAWYSTTSLPETLQYPTYSKINDIEKILDECNTAIEGMIASFFYCGEIFAGEE